MSNTTAPYAQGVLFPEEEWNLVQQTVAKLNAEQRLWLSGYLAGCMQEIGQNKALNDPVITGGLLIAYGGETGNSMQLANMFSKLAMNERLSPSVSDLAKLKLRHLQREQVAVFICSTHGDGEPPETMKMFHKELQQAKSGSLKELSYAVLALGDSSYERFCQTGKDIDDFLKKTGAKRLLPRVECDVDFEEDAESWMKELLPLLKNLLPEEHREEPKTGIAKNTAQTLFSKNSPGIAHVLDKTCLSHPSRNTGYWHVELSPETPLNIQPGDAIGVFPKNDKALISFTLKVTGLNPDEIIKFKDQENSLSNVLADSVDLVIVNKKTLMQWAQWYKNAELKNIMHKDAKEIRNYLKNIQLIDLLNQYPVRPKAQEFVDCLRPLQPRLYDLVNYQPGQQDEIHLLVKNYQYWFNSRIENGVTSQYFSTLSGGDEIKFYSHINQKFHLPENKQCPLILIAVGSGIGPYRAFLDFYKTQASTPPVWIIFQENQYEQDFLYQLEWQEKLTEGLLTHFDGVFVNDDPKSSLAEMIGSKQDRLNQWLAQGAHVYFCGDKEVLSDTENEIKDYVTQLKEADGNQDNWAWLVQQNRIHKNLY